MKDAAPSSELRNWFGHDPEKFDEFARRYMSELDKEPIKREAVKQLLEISKTEKLTLLYASRDPSINHALILKNFLEKKLMDSPQTP